MSASGYELRFGSKQEISFQLTYTTCNSLVGSLKNTVLFAGVPLDQNELLAVFPQSRQIALSYQDFHKELKEPFKYFCSGDHELRRLT